MTIRQKEGQCDYIVIVICNSTYFLLYIFVVHLALFCTTIYYTNTTTTFSQYYQLYGVVQCLLSPIPLVHTTWPMYAAEYRLLSNDYSDFVPLAKLYVGAICVCFTWQVSWDCSFALFLFWTKFHPLLTPPRFLTRLTATGDLSHLARESLGAELAGEVVQGAWLPLVQQTLQKEQQRHIPSHFVLHCLHVAVFAHWTWVYSALSEVCPWPITHNTVTVLSSCDCELLNQVVVAMDAAKTMNERNGEFQVDMSIWWQGRVSVGLSLGALLLCFGWK